MLPSFFTDSSDSMKFEEVIDFFMSWTIRCADDKNRTVSPLVHNNSKAILAKLIGVEEYEELVFTDIEVWKQHRHIDLWCEFKFNNQLHALVIETKMYSKFRKDQLKSYKDLVKKYYNDKGLKHDFHFVALRPDYELAKKHPFEQAHCDSHDYIYLNLEQLQDVCTTLPTGNDLFDEFWYRWGIRD